MRGCVVGNLYGLISLFYFNLPHLLYTKGEKRALVSMIIHHILLYLCIVFENSCSEQYTRVNEETLRQTKKKYISHVMLRFSKFVKLGFVLFQ